MECDICCNVFSSTNEPKILTNCGHSFCSVCIQSMCSTEMANVQCPHCRAITPISLIKTNYAIANIISAEANRSEQNEMISCWIHPNQGVSLFCATCSIFICPDCYEVGNSIHSNHLRIPLKDGVERTVIEMRIVKERFQSLCELNDKVLAFESYRAAQASADLETTYKAASQYYFETVRLLEEEFSRIEQLVLKYENLIARHIDAVEGPKDEIEKAVRALIKIPQTLQGAVSFTLSRQNFERILEKTNFPHYVTNELDQISLADSNVLVCPQLPLPKVIPKNTRISSLFEVTEPSFESHATQPSESKKSLVRSTSSDRLSN
jgi:hypothetical protein